MLCYALPSESGIRCTKDVPSVSFKQQASLSLSLSLETHCKVFKKITRVLSQKIPWFRPQRTHTVCAFIVLRSNHSYRSDKNEQTNKQTNNSTTDHSTAPHARRCGSILLSLSVFHSGRATAIRNFFVFHTSTLSTQNTHSFRIRTIRESKERHRCMYCRSTDTQTRAPCRGRLMWFLPLRSIPFHPNQTESVPVFFSDLSRQRSSGRNPTTRCRRHRRWEIP